MKIVVILFLIFIVGSLGSALYFLIKDRGQSDRMVKALTVRVVLNRGAAAATVWTCDLSHEYVTINAEYRT